MGKAAGAPQQQQQQQGSSSPSSSSEEEKSPTKKKSLIRRLSLTMTNQSMTESSSLKKLPSPPPPSPSKKKTVSFHNKKKSKRVPSWRTMSPKEINDIWYSKSDYAEFGRGREELLFILEAGYCEVMENDDDDEYCFRGLEGKTKVGRNLRCTQKRLAYDAVWEEQEIYWAKKEELDTQIMEQQHNKAPSAGDLLQPKEQQEEGKQENSSSSSLSIKLSKLDAQMERSVADSYIDATAPAMQTAIARGKQDFLEVQEYLRDAVQFLQKLFPEMYEDYYIDASRASFSSIEL